MTLRATYPLQDRGHRVCRLEANRSTWFFDAASLENFPGGGVCSPRRYSLLRRLNTSQTVGSTEGPRPFILDTEVDYRRPAEGSRFCPVDCASDGTCTRIRARMRSALTIKRQPDSSTHTADFVELLNCRGLAASHSDFARGRTCCGADEKALLAAFRNYSVDRRTDLPDAFSLHLVLLDGLEPSTSDLPCPCSAY